jgi:hypothetical protein
LGLGFVLGLDCSEGKTKHKESSDRYTEEHG